MCNWRQFGRAQRRVHLSKPARENYTWRADFPRVLSRAPANLAAHAISQTQVGLTWNESLTAGGATQISIERATSAGGPYAPVAQVNNALSYVDTVPSAGTYFYRVRAQNVTQWSFYSSVASADTTSASSVPAPFDQLVVWLKADSGLAQIGTSTGPDTPVNFWADQSGNNNDATQPTSPAGDRPLWVPDAQNGLPVIQFSGVEKMNLPNCLTPLSFSGAEIFAVVRVSDFPTTQYYYQTLWSLGASGDLGNEMYPYYDGSTYSIVENFGRTGGGWNIGVPAQPLNQYHIYEVAAAQNGDWSAWVSINDWTTPQYHRTDNSIGFGASPTLGTTPGLNGQAASFKGDIAEILIFNSPLTDDKRNVVRTYLKDKYGL